MGIKCFILRIMNITKRQRWLIAVLITLSGCLLLFFSLSVSGKKVEKKTVSNASSEKINGEDLKQLEVVLSGVTVNSTPKVKTENSKPAASTKTVKTVVKKPEVSIPQIASNKYPETKEPPRVATRATPVLSEEGVSSHYIIQLIAGSELPSILQYIRVHNLKGKARWYRTSLEGQVWYILAYGHYSSRAEAMVALNALPRSLRTKGPFIKSLSAIKRAS